MLTHRNQQAAKLAKAKCPGGGWGEVRKPSWKPDPPKEESSLPPNFQNPAKNRGNTEPGVGATPIVLRTEE